VDVKAQIAAMEEQKAGWTAILGVAANHIRLLNQHLGALRREEAQAQRIADALAGSDCTGLARVEE
jgi:hypothetical protein